MFTPEDLELVKKITMEMFDTSRAEISREICRRLQWYKIDGGLKEMSGKNVLARLEKEGIIALPKPKTKNNNQKLNITFSKRTDPKTPVECGLHELLPIKLVKVIKKTDKQLWNEYVHRYHYLGYIPFPGGQIRYFIESPKGLLGCISFSASAWKTMPRDRWIGWTHEQRKARLHLIVNNSRFLLFPWVKVKNLASKVLSLSAKQLPEDWLATFKYKPVLLETFVEKDRFKGTCYLAANWQWVGVTTGRGKPDTKRKVILPIKDILMFPLTIDFRFHLLGEPEQGVY
jgi:hypothetical protein